jgi:two-component system NtrC family sensor kinase
MDARRAVGAVTRTLGWRLVVTLTASLLLLLGISGWLALELHRQHLYSVLERTAVEMGETILSSARSSMMENDRRQLGEIIRNIGARESVVALRLVNAAGEVQYSSRPEEVGHIHGLDSPVCQTCHSGETARIPDDLREGLRRFRLDGGEGALALGYPVLNSIGCSTAACHVHPAERRVLGVLDLELSTASLDAAVADAGSQMAWLGAATIIVVAGVIGGLAWRTVHRPIRDVLSGVRRLGGGDLAHRLAPSGPSEIAELAESVNRMAARLQSANAELADWNRTLEARIEENTRQLERTRDQMVFAEKMSSLGKLAAIVAHELNNPLAGILVSAKLLRRRLAKAGDGSGPGTASGDEGLAATIAAETARCGDIVKNLLLFSRRGEGGFEPTDVNALAERVLKLIRHRADLEEVTIRCELGEDVPEIRASAGELQQALLAILINALEAMPEGGELGVSTRPDPPGAEPTGVIVEVSDTGVGIPEDLRARIFEPFFTTKAAGKATGLGLAVVWGIVERHGGRVDVESGEGRTTFRLFLPIQPPPYPHTLPELLRFSEAAPKDEGS